MRMDPPGGQTVDLHRRCWIGRGGSTPAGAVRVTGRKLGYDTDLDFVFPISTAVFKSGGDLAFHHGGPSLQELIVPVITVKARPPLQQPDKRSNSPLTRHPRVRGGHQSHLHHQGRAHGLDSPAACLTDPGCPANQLCGWRTRPVALAALAVGGELQNGRLKLAASDPEISVGFHPEQTSSVSADRDPGTGCRS